MPLVRRPSANAAPNNTTAASLISDSSDERWVAARGADSAASVPALAEALARETNARVREAIFTALARIATRESASAVVPFLRSDEANVRAGALDALRAMPHAARSHLSELLTDKDPDVRLLACDLVLGTGGGDDAGLLLDLIEKEHEANVCAAAVEVLAEIGDARALPVLSRCGSRFPNDPFLAYAIQIASSRLAVGAASRRD